MMSRIAQWFVGRLLSLAIRFAFKFLVDTVHSLPRSLSLTEVRF